MIKNTTQYKTENPRSQDDKIFINFQIFITYWQNFKTRKFTSKRYNKKRQEFNFQKKIPKITFNKYVDWQNLGTNIYVQICVNTFQSTIKISLLYIQILTPPKNDQGCNTSIQQIQQVSKLFLVKKKPSKQPKILVQVQIKIEKQQQNTNIYPQHTFVLYEQVLLTAQKILLISQKPHLQKQLYHSKINNFKYLQFLIFMIQLEINCCLGPQKQMVVIVYLAGYNWLQH
eukprot:TRINITY_DN3157_c0_g1_i3.p3 TRINITY_DN3157_c0_g1~~TRINITY_DN3157_c0_g1_i3.p3  ORF type:complete len:229 (+),score=0.25 TRINITY_DN3157_c0_g1_i3:2404-3090(+)